MGVCSNASATTSKAANPRDALKNVAFLPEFKQRARQLMGKSSNKNGVSRRQFLRGAGGFALALPVLTSPRPRSAWASSDLVNIPPRFVNLASHHGGVWGVHMYPGGGTLTHTQSYAGYTIRSGELAAQAPRAGYRQLSPTLSAPTALLSDDIVERMNVLRGIRDIMPYLGHHTGGHLGNYARADNLGDTIIRPTQTIDQVMAYSSRLPRPSTVRRRSIHVGQSSYDGSSTGREMSWV